MYMDTESKKRLELVTKQSFKDFGDFHMRDKFNNTNTGYKGNRLGFKDLPLVKTPKINNYECLYGSANTSNNQHSNLLLNRNESEATFTSQIYGHKLAAPTSFIMEEKEDS
jgi:hypothetical protein